MALKSSPAIGFSPPPLDGGHVALQPPRPSMPGIGLGAYSSPTHKRTVPQRGRIAPPRRMGNYVPGFGYIGGMEAGEEEDVGFDPYLDALREMLGSGDPRQTNVQRQTDLLSALRGY